MLRSAVAGPRHGAPGHAERWPLAPGAPDAEALGVRRAGARLLAVAPGFETAVSGLDLLATGALEAWLVRAPGPRGRTRTALLPLAGHDERLHLRPVRHGGLLRGVLRDRLAGLGRPLAELRALAELRRRGVAVPRPVLLLGWRRAGGLWSAAVGTLFEEEARDGQAFLAEAPAQERLLRACAAAGRSVRRLHDAGGRHRDLHVGNLLVRERGGDTEVLVVDLDRARVGEAAGARARMAEIMRLRRSLVKRGLDDRVGAPGRAAFLDAYTGNDAGLRRALLAQLPRERRRLAWHRLGHRLRLT